MTQSTNHDPNLQLIPSTPPDWGWFEWARPKASWYTWAIPRRTWYNWATPYVTRRPTTRRGWIATSIVVVLLALVLGWWTMGRTVAKFTSQSLNNIAAMFAPAEGGEPTQGTSPLAPPTTTPTTAPTVRAAAAAVQNTATPVVSPTTRAVITPTATASSTPRAVVTATKPITLAFPIWVTANTTMHIRTGGITNALTVTLMTATNEDETGQWVLLNDEHNPAGLWAEQRDLYMSAGWENVTLPVSPWQDAAASGTVSFWLVEGVELFADPGDETPMETITTPGSAKACNRNEAKTALQICWDDGALSWVKVRDGMWNKEWDGLPVSIVNGNHQVAQSAEIAEQPTAMPATPTTAPTLIPTPTTAPTPTPAPLAGSAPITSTEGSKVNPFTGADDSGLE